MRKEIPKARAWTDPTHWHYLKYTSRGEPIQLAIRRDIGLRQAWAVEEESKE